MQPRQQSVIRPADRNPKAFPSKLEILLEEKCATFTLYSVRERLGVRDLVQGPLVPPVHLGDGLAPRGLHDDHDGSSQHANPAQPKEDQKHKASSHPPTRKRDNVA